VRRTGFRTDSREIVLSPHAVAAREFGKRGTFGPPLAGLVLLRLPQFWFPAHALPAFLCPFERRNPKKKAIRLYVRYACASGFLLIRRRLRGAGRLLVRRATLLHGSAGWTQ
jgi:hypothetical protein